MAWREREVELGGIRLAYLEAGEGPLVVLLHGFPDSALTWRYQRDRLVRAGHRVVTPWLRGYGASSKPRRTREYSVQALAGDVEELIHTVGGGRAAAVAGHDWGGVIAWRLALDRPDLVERLIVLNAPHPAAMARELRRPEQLRRSWYAVFFQLPWLPERLLRAGRFASVRRAIARMVRRPGAFGDVEWREIRATLSEPGALHAALSYYRAAARGMLRRRSGTPGATRMIEVPTLLLWGDQDDALGPRLLEGLEGWVEDLTLRRFADAGHWVHWDEPDAVAEEMLTFLARPVARPAPMP